jgi:hypothetical protein
MEAQDAAGVPNMKHNCKLWLSFDSPHLGANISIGLQQYIKMLAQVTGSADAYSTYNGNLCAPASRQLLIHQTDHDSSSAVFNVLMDNSAPERAAWMNTLNTFGYPTKCRNIALSNGSSMGGYYRNPGAELIGLQVGNTINAKLDFMSRQLAETGFSSTTFEASFTHLAGVKGVWLKNWWNPFAIVPTYATDQLATCTITNNSVFGAIDACPGSFFDVQSTIRTSITEGVVSGIAAGVDSLATVNTTINNVLNTISAALSSPFGLTFNTTLLGGQTLRDISNMAEMFAFSQISFPKATQNISFISTISSLGLIDHQFNWSLPLAKNLVCNNSIPFDAYYVPKNNEEHVSFTPESWAWLKEELLHGRGGADCFDVCATRLDGNANTCKGTAETYTLDVAIPNIAGYYTTYKVSTGLSITTTTNNAIKVIASAGGSQWIEATIKSPCAPDKIVTAYINVVDPTITYAGGFTTMAFGNPCLPEIIWATTNTSLTGYTV